MAVARTGCIGSAHGMAAKKKPATKKPSPVKKKPAAKKRPKQTLLDVLLAKALSYPGAHEDHPWGETVAKVAKKVFLFSFQDETRWSASFKLPESRGAALVLPFAEPTGYGLGAHGWVSVKFLQSEEAPLPLLLEWLDESYRAVAPKKLVSTLG